MTQIARNFLLTVCLAGFALAQSKAANKPNNTAASAASSQAKTKAAAKAQPVTPGPTGPISIPKDAVEVEPGLYQAKDAAGKTWHYTRTPFGVRRFEPQRTEDTTAEEASRISVVAKEGDTVSFERKTPFGSAKWTKKRDQLNAAEKLAMERPKQPSSAPAAAAAKAAKQ